MIGAHDCTCAACGARIELHSEGGCSGTGGAGVRPGTGPARLRDLDGETRAHLRRLARRTGDTPSILLGKLLSRPLTADEVSTIVDVRLDELDEEVPPGPCERCRKRTAEVGDLLCAPCRVETNRRFEKKHGIPAPGASRAAD